MTEKEPLPGGAGDAPSSGAPLRALVISVAALLVSLAGALFFTESLGEYRPLLWLLALIPALLLALYRGWRMVTLALGLGMAVLSLTYVGGHLLGAPIQDWPLDVVVVAAYIGIALGGGWLTELHTAMSKLRAKERELQRAIEELSASHDRLQSTQLQLIQAEKLESVGMLAAGVAHEVKNPLMTLLTGVELLKRFPEQDRETLRLLLDDMWLAVKRADSVIKGLLNYSRARDLFVKDDDVNDLVSRSIPLVKHECDRVRITVVAELADDLPAVRIDSYKIQQVLVNLFTNSIHAMDRGGRLTVRTRWADMDGAGTGGDGSEVPPAILIEVEDDGHGIPYHALSKIYDPFFSTKPTGDGTGLGLSVSRQIMEMHGGELDVGNRAEGGVRAVLTLRLGTKEIANAKEAYPAGG